MEQRLVLIFIILIAPTVLFFIFHASKQGTKGTTITIGLGGDTMLGRGVNRVIDRTSYQYPWGNILPLLRAMDFMLINLETTLTTSTNTVAKTFNFKADPDKVRTLLDAHIDVVSLANNHILDFSVAGLRETIATLNAAGIYHVGAGENEDEARKSAILTKEGITIGVLGYTDNEPTWKAGKDKPGTNYISIDDIEPIKQAVQTLRKVVDVVIITLHWGPNMREKPTKKFQQFARSLIDVGVDIVHGHSAHIFQGIEVYKNKLILYDTGDLVDDYAVTAELRNDHSFWFQVKVKKQGDNSTLTSLKLTPLIISNAQVNQATGSDKEAILARMRTLSLPFGTVISSDGVITITS